MANRSENHKANHMADAGFSLIEALVAMAVLAVGAVSLLAAAQTHGHRVRDISDRVEARWIAQNTLTALRLGLPAEPSQHQLGQTWEVTVHPKATGDPVLRDVTVRVGQNGQTRVSLRGFYLEGGR